MPNITVPAAALGLPIPHPRLVELIEAKKLRKKIERTVSHLIEALDALDAPFADLEPTNGGAQEADRDPATVDAEGDPADCPLGELDDAQGEPSLGSPEMQPWHSQTRWAAGGDRGDREEACEDEGADIQSQPHDAEPDEENGDERDWNGDEIDGAADDDMEPAWSRIEGGQGA